MMIDGKVIAAAVRADTKAAVTALGRTPVLTVFSCDANFATNKYLTIKQREAEAVGVEMRVQEFDAGAQTEDVASAIRSAIPRSDGIVVQLPFPATIDTASLLELIPASHDVDALNPTTTKSILSPVVGAIEAILNYHQILVGGMNVVVVGAGKLVGQPTAEWARAVGGFVTVIDEHTPEAGSLIKKADIVVLGIGKAGFLTPNLVTKNMVVLDAGTSELGGKLVGDADPDCAELVKLLTPVPGGIGPVAVSVLFKNLVTLARQ